MKILRLEDYSVRMRNGRTFQKGIDAKNGKRRKLYGFEEIYKTNAGMFKKEEWNVDTYKIIDECGDGKIRNKPFIDIATAIDIIKEESINNGWTSISILPTSSDDYLCDFGTHQRVLPFNLGQNGFYNEYGRKYPVIAWQTLPEHYKG